MGGGAHPAGALTHYDHRTTPFCPIWSLDCAGDVTLQNSCPILLGAGAHHCYTGSESLTSLGQMCPTQEAAHWTRSWLDWQTCR